MTMNRVDEGELLLPLYGGLRDDPPWSTFLHRLVARTGGDRVGLSLRHAHVTTADHGNIVVRRDGDVSVMAGPGLPDAVHHDALRPGRVYRGEELLTMDDGARSAFWRAAIRASGARYLRIMRVSEPSGLSAWVTLLDDRADFSAADGALLGGLAPHLTVALTNFAALGEMRLRAAMADDAAGRSGLGWAALDAKARLIIASPIADQMMSRTAGRRLPGDRLFTAHPAAGRALADAAAAFHADPDLPGRVIRVDGAPPIDLLAAPFRARMAGLVAAPAMVLFMQAREGAGPRDRAAQIAQLHGLTRSEGRLADALLNGLSIAQAAAALNLTEDTARNYSKRLYAKTRTRGQADLIRLLAHGIARLA
ncbi:MAG: helix-turn-helix transcriptional regulator [Sphingobium sp.]